MSRILLIETSTSLCSVALAADGKIVSSRESSTPRAQASMTAVFVKEILDEQGMMVKDCDAVCVSSGPGSYTGLRVGVSTAKGLCFPAGIPLISVNTLQVLACQAISENLLPDGCRYIIPMIDARRMEVYTAVFDPEGRQLGSIEAKVVDKDSFREEMAEGPVLFVGDGAAKCADLLDNPYAKFVQTNPHADAMLVPAMQAFEQKRFEDTAYFEPFYLKQFVATVSRKNLF